MERSRRLLSWLAALGYVLGLATPSAAVTITVQCGSAQGYDIHFSYSFDTIPPEMMDRCSDTFECAAPESVGPYVEKVTASCNAQGNNLCAVRLVFPLKFRGNETNIQKVGLSSAPTPYVLWFNGAADPDCMPWLTTACGQVSLCGESDNKIQYDIVPTFLNLGNASCNNPTPTLHSGLFSILATSCPSRFSCPKRTFADFTVTDQMVKKALGCPEPKKICNGSEQACPNCLAGGTSAGGDAPGVPGRGGPGGNNGPGAFLNYAGGQVGRAGYPGSAVHNVTLGRYWSHEYAEQIVADGSPNLEDHVWLLTRYATLEEWAEPDVNGVYPPGEPADEKRTLTYLGVGLGWELRDLDGTVDAFDDSGAWTTRTDRDGNVTTGVYDGSGNLDYVTLPDGLTEDFAYDSTSGKLSSITVIGVDTTSTHVWSYFWTGDDLTRVERPDNTALVYAYDDGRFPGYLTSVTLEGTDGTTTRVERAWEYDDSGNVVKTWRGDTTSTGPNATELWQLSFDDPAEPTVTTVTDPKLKVSTYHLDRTGVAPNFRVTQIDGDCPVCTMNPNSQLHYDDTANPFLPTSITDGRLITTAISYTPTGQVESRTEAMGESEARTTSWTYDSTYPALPTGMDEPSVAGGSSMKTTTWTLDPANGDVTTRSLYGSEAGSSLPALDTVISYNGHGQPLTIDPPGYGTDDVTSFTYDNSSRGGLFPLTRVDPLPGSMSGMTTTYDYDPFNRRKSVVDPNGLETDTTYDALDRVTEIRQVGESPPGDDLVTAYAYDQLKNLKQVTLPAGNVIEYDYDPVGRLTSVERKPDAATHGERTHYTLDAAGNRTLEEHQRWDPDAQDWVTVSSTAYEYDNRCQVHAVHQAPGTAEEATTTFGYDCDGNLEQVWDPSANPDTDPATTTYIYDHLNRVTSVSQPWQPTGGSPGTAVTSYSYDVQDHLTGVTDAEGNATSYVYSDRDLLTYEQSDALVTSTGTCGPPTCSAGCGCTQHTYNLHGQEDGSTDARGVTVGRTTDELDRVTNVDYPDDTLDTAYAYDTAPGSCGGTSSPVGRLASITRNGQTLDDCYDHFGRMVKDGELGYGWDANGNRTAVVYPGGVSAAYGFDFADRQTSLEVTTPAGGMTLHPVVTGATYLPSGPLSGLALGNGATEARAFDQRYVPTAITLSGLASGAPGHTWAYTTDPAGNVTEILETPECSGGGSTLILENQTVTTDKTFTSCADLQAGNNFAVQSPGHVTFQAQGKVVLTSGFSVGSGASFAAGAGSLPTYSDRTFSYQAPQYYLTSADGPWGTLDWSYDKIGNRLSEDRSDGLGPDTYEYTVNTGGGDTPLLHQVSLGVGSTRDYAWDDAGNLDSVAPGGNLVDFTFDDASRLSQVDHSASSSTTAFLYDGRGFLRSATQTAGGTASVAPLYDSSGLLHALTRQPSSTDPVATTYVFYLAGRPVAQLAIDSSDNESWTYLTTDHIGTPLVATDQGGAITWDGGFRPFGTDYQAGTGNGASDYGIPLRLPGQWVDDTWTDATSGAAIYQNTWRWFSPSVGRFTSVDPFGPRGGDPNAYLYAKANPLSYIDPSGLQLVVPPPDPYVPYPPDPVPAGCSPGPWRFISYEYRPQGLREIWDRVRTTPIKLPRLGRGTGSGGTLGCTCYYALRRILRVTKQYSKWEQTVTCPPCEQFNRTRYRAEQELPTPIPFITAPGLTRTTYAPLCSLCAAELRN